VSIVLPLGCRHLVEYIPVTSLAAGYVGDKIGRRGTLFVGSIVFTLGGLIQTVCIGFNTMCLGRIISGFGVGLLSYVHLLWFSSRPKLSCDRTIVPIYQSEVSPADHVCLSPAGYSMISPHASEALWLAWSLRVTLQDTLFLL
jgi:MFS family permease